MEKVSKRVRTITIDENCEFVKNLIDKLENGEKNELLAKARKSKISFKNQINDFEEQLDDLDNKVLIAKSTLPLDANAILDAEDDIALLERRLKAAKKLYKELFSEEIKG